MLKSCELRLLIIARRMKRHGARWSEKGADHLARLLAKKGNGELTEVLKSEWKRKPEVIKRLVGDQKVIVGKNINGLTDPGAWLRATMPVLCGPSQNEPWVKYVMRYLAEALPRIA